MDALMWSCLIEICDIGMQDTVQLLLTEDQHVVKALSSHTPQETFTDGIGSWRAKGCFENLDAACGCNSSETGSKLAIMITDEIPGGLSIRSCLPQLLGSPGVSRRSRHLNVDDLARFQCNDVKRKERLEAQVSDVQEIAGPDLPSMSAQEGCPALPS